MSTRQRQFFWYCLFVLVISIPVLLLAQTMPKPPKAKRVDFVEDLHGTKIPDPYRWLEDQWSKETRVWLEEQETYARTILNDLPALESIKAKLKPDYDAERISPPKFVAGRYYYTRKPRGAERFSLYSRKELDGEETLVIDPDEISNDPTVTLGLLEVYAQGKYLAYIVRDGGEDEVTIRIRDLETGNDLSDIILRGMNSRLSFNHAGDGFYYTTADKIHGSRVLFHRLGTSLKEDMLIYQAERREYGVGVNEIEDGTKLFLELRYGWQRQEYYIKGLKGSRGWEPIVQDIDAQFQPHWIEKKFWVITDFGAPYSRVVEIDLKDPAPDRWREVIPEKKDVLQGLTFIDGRLYLLYLHDAAHEIHICEPDGTFIRRLELPGRGRAELPQRTGEKGWLMFTFESFTHPSTIFLYDPVSTERKIWSQPDYGIDTSDMVVKQEWFESNDGTRAPIWVVHRKGLKLDGSNPTLLHGYGGFNVANLPRCSAFNLAWIRQGGIMALATLRGGSEFGRAWHKGGMLKHKQNVFDDFIAAAEYLIQRGYTNPTKLAIKGGSNGGLLMGAAFTQRPDLYQAVVATVPEFDIVGFPRYRNINPPALMEYGDASKPEEFEFIIHWSPYQNVRRGVEYPAILVVTGDMDSRVSPIEALKTVARLQWATSSDRPIIFNYNPRMGHSGGRPPSVAWRDSAWEMAFLNWQLGIANPCRD